MTRTGITYRVAAKNLLVAGIAIELVEDVLLSLPSPADGYVYASDVNDYIDGVIS